LTSADDAEEDGDKEEDEEEKVLPEQEIKQDEENDNWPTPFDECSGRGDDDDDKEEGEASVPTKEENVKEETEASETDEPENAPVAATAINASEEKEKVRQADRHKDRGNAHMSKKEYEKALQHYDLAIASSPSGPNSHVYYSNRAAAYCYLTRYDAASADCRRSVELNPKYEKAHARLGLSLFLRGDYRDAILAYERSLELDPKNKASVSYLRKAKAKLAEDRLEQEKKREEQKKANVAESHMVVEEEAHDASSSSKRTGDHGSSFARARMARIMEEHRKRQQCNQQPIAEEGEEDAGSMGDETGITSTGLASIVTKEDDDDDNGAEHHDENRGLAFPAEESHDFPPSPTIQAFDPFDTTDAY